ncbi:hypothetical protein ES705_50929 [subsurface metagenome]
MSVQVCIPENGSSIAELRFINTGIVGLNVDPVEIHSASARAISPLVVESSNNSLGMGFEVRNLTGLVAISHDNNVKSLVIRTVILDFGYAQDISIRGVSSRGYWKH